MYLSLTTIIMRTTPTPAQAIKKELKTLFPWVKFSCTYDTYSMGSSVDVNWMDWPTEKEVEGHIKKYQYGHFDGMTDYYDSDNWREDIPQAKYVFAKRTMSPETAEIIIGWAVNTMTEADKYRYYDVNTMARNLFYYYPITSKNITINSSSSSCSGSVENRYEIVCS